MTHPRIKDFFIVQESMTGANYCEVEPKALITMDKGEVGQYFDHSTDNGYFIALRLKTNEKLKIPYAPGFVQFVGQNEPKSNLDEDFLDGGLDENFELK